MRKHSSNTACEVLKQNIVSRNKWVNFTSSFFRPPTVDLGLPEQKKKEDVKVVTVSEPKFKFVEKKAPPLGSELVAFKKRNKRKTGFQFRKKEDS